MQLHSETHTEPRRADYPTAEAWFADLLDQYRDDPVFLTESLLLDVTEQIAVRMQELGLRPVDLAERLGVSRAHVSQLLAGKPNMTMRTLVNVALALDQRVSIKLTCVEHTEHGCETLAEPVVQLVKHRPARSRPRPKV